MNVKLVGNFIQYLEVTLDPREEFYAEKGALIYLECGIEKESMFNGNSLGRLLGAKLSGESIFIVRYFNASPYPRKLVLGSSATLHPVKMEGETLVCRSGAYVASSRRMDINTKFSITGLVGGMGLMLQKITGHATVFLDCKGTPMVIPLPPGHSIDIDEKHVIALRGIDDSRMQAQWSFRNFVGGEGLSLLHVTGPGEVILSPGSMLPVIATV